MRMKKRLAALLAVLLLLAAVPAVAQAEDAWILDKLEKDDVHLDPIPLLIVKINYDADGDGKDAYIEGVDAKTVKESGEQWTHTTDSYWSKMCFSDTKSLKNYYKTVSNGSFYFYPAEETYADASAQGRANDGVVTVTIPYAHPNSTTGTVDTEDHLSRLAALEASDEYVDYASFDKNGDGYIDGVEVVYTTQNSTPGMSGTADAGSSGLWWNFTTNTGASPNVASPKAHRIFWTRYDYVTNNYYVKEAQGDPENNIPAQGQVWEGKAVDAHTIIHETGHMMGAPDYYSYDRTEGPAGQVDMMDNNVGDHNAYTKMIYNWVAPRVVDGSSDNFTITLKSFTETGDFLLVKPTADPWNETPYDEYLMLQYYTPTGLNEKDSTGYPEWSNATSASGSAAYGHGGTYEYPGLQVFHVDTRVSSEKAKLAENGSIDESTLVTNYTDTPLPAEKTDTAAGTYESEARRVHDNTPSRSTDGATGENTPFRELQAVFATTTNTTAGTSYYNSFGLMTNLFGDEDFKAKNDTGTKKESYYGNDTYSNYYSRSFYPNDLLWNDGNRFDWTFHVESQTDEEITLHFIKTPADNDAFTD